MILFGIIALCVFAVNGEKHYVVQGRTSATDTFDPSHPTSECLDSDSRVPSQDTSRGWGLAVRCCSMDGSSGYSPDCQSHGANGASFEDAESLCSSRGLRLCTLDEALSGVAEGSGCMYDHVYHWVSDECGSSTDTKGPLLYAGEYLFEDEEMFSNDHKMRLKVQSDGNVVIYEVSTGNAMWSTNTRRDDAAGKEVKLYLDPLNGQLKVLFDDQIVWKTNVCHFQPGHMSLHKDSSLQLKDVNLNAYWNRHRPEDFPAECQGTPPVIDLDGNEDIEMSRDEWIELASGVDLCDPIEFRGTANPSMPSVCPDGYIKEGLGEWDMMCLEECPVGWSANPDLIDPACWKDCPAGWNTVGPFCENLDEMISDKGVVERGVGVIPNDCGSGKVMESGLCYNECADGWNGFGCFCYEGIVFFSRSYGRGCGTIPNQCPSSHPSLEAGLCYRNCPSSHPEGVAFQCWEDCESRGEDVIDMGVYCQHPIEIAARETRLRGHKDLQCADGKVMGISEIGAALCMYECPGGYMEAGPVCIEDDFPKTLGLIALTAAQLVPIQLCYTAISPYVATAFAFAMDPDTFDAEGLDFGPFLDCAWTLIETMAAVDPSWSQDNGVTVAVTADAAGSVSQWGGSAFYGLAFEFETRENVKVWHFGGVCASTSLITGDGGFGAGLSAGMSIYRSKEDIEGAELYTQLGASVLAPVGIMVDAGVSYSYDSECRISGMTSYQGVSLPDSDLSTGGAVAEKGICVTRHVTQIGSDLLSPSARSSAKAPMAPRPIPTGTRQRDLEENADDHSVGHGVEGKDSRARDEPNGGGLGRRSSSIHRDEDSMLRRPSQIEQPVDGQEEEEGVFVMELSYSTVVIVALCAVVLLMTAILCWQCRRQSGRRGVYSKVDMVTDSDLEAARLN